MRAGHFRDRVTFQRRAATDDGYGNTVSGDWAALQYGGQDVTVWADMLERLGGERLAAGALESTKMATIRVRISAAILTVQASDRIYARGDYWNIKSIADVGRRSAEREYTCETGAEQ